MIITQEKQICDIFFNEYAAKVTIFFNEYAAKNNNYR